MNPARIIVDDRISPPVVGGEVLHVNPFEVFLLNFWWILLLILPALLYLFYGKRLIRYLPTPLLRLVTFLTAH